MITEVSAQGVSQAITENLLLKIWGGFPSDRWLLPEDSRLTNKYKDQLGEAISRRFGLALESSVATPRQERLNMLRDM